MKYKIVFRGKFNPEVSENDILENLSELFDESTESIHQGFFSLKDQEKILISGLDNDDAEEYKAALLEAGVEVDIDIDLDIEDLSNFNPYLSDEPKHNARSSTKKSLAEDANIDVGLSLTLNLIEETTQPTGLKTNKNDIRSRFLETQQFTLAKDENNLQAEEDNRVEKLKRIAKKRQEAIEIDDREVSVEPPLFHSGVRIGRLRFLCRITLAMAILISCINVLPLYLKDWMGGSSFIPSFFFVFFAFMFVIMVISQRFCDVDNLTVGSMIFVVVVAGTFLISVFINHYYSLGEEKIQFARDFLQSNSMHENFFTMQETLNAYLKEASQKHLIQQIDSIIKWIVYIFVFGGAILLFAVPGVEGNNQFGAPSESPDVKSYVVFVVSFFVLLYGLSLPYSSRANKAEYNLYQSELYEYLGLLKPLPKEFEAAYREHLHKTQQKLVN